MTEKNEPGRLRFHYSSLALGGVLLVAVMLLGLNWLNRKREHEAELSLRAKICRQPTPELEIALAEFGSSDSTEIDADHRVWSLLEIKDRYHEDDERLDLRVMKETGQGWLVWDRWSKRPTLELGQEALALVEENGCGSKADDGRIRVAHRVRTKAGNTFLIVAERTAR